MCILQDFESITPNVLCRTIETVEGGGLVVMLFNTMTSLKQLYTISMDVHARYRTEAHSFVEPRFNERFILSLGSCETCIAIDDELNILPITSHIKDIKEVQLPGLAAGDAAKPEDLYLTNEQRELKELKISLKDTKPIGNLVNVCKTLDQARSVMQIVDTISEKSLKTTISLPWHLPCQRHSLWFQQHIRDSADSREPRQRV
jgi:N-acetyltransferase 10